MSEATGQVTTPAEPVRPARNIVMTKLAAIAAPVDPNVEARRALIVAQNFLTCAKALVAAWPSLDAETQDYVKAQPQFAALMEL